MVTNQDTAILFGNDVKLSGFMRPRQSRFAYLSQILPLDADRFRHLDRGPTCNIQNPVKAFFRHQGWVRQRLVLSTLK